MVKRKKDVQVKVDVKKPKTEKKHDTNPVVNVLADLYKKTVHVSTLPTKERQKEVQENLSRKLIPKDVVWYPIYADQPDSYQADLMFEPIQNTKDEIILQAILCVININTKYAFAEPVDYVKNIKKLEERA